MQNSLIQNIKVIHREYKKVLLATLYLSIRTIFSILILFHSNQNLAAIFELCALALLFAFVVFLIIKKRHWVSNILSGSIVFILIANSIAVPYIPFDLLLIIPVYQMMKRKFHPRAFIVLAVFLAILILDIQSQLFFSSVNLPNDPLLQYRWLFSLLSIAAVFSIQFDAPQILHQEDCKGNLFDSIEEYSTVINAVDIGLWSWDIFDNIFKLTRQCGNMMGVSNNKDETIISFHGFSPVMQSLHSGDKEAFRKALFDISNGITDNFEIIVRTIINRDTQLWLKIKASRQTDESGKATQISGSMIDITQHIQYERQSQFIESFDPLTNLPNKKSISEQINSLIIDEPDPDEINFGVMILNIDRFNAINESLGRSVGDDLLKAFAQRLEKCMRMVDGVAKLSEDTFIVLVSHVNTLQNIFIIIERIQERIQMPFWIQRNEIYITASIGIALYHPEISDADDILQEAEIAMYNAKAMGKGTHVIYKPDMREKVTRRHHIERDLRKAIENQEFELYYQPILSLESGMISGVEALIRWNHPTKGMVFPADFIPVAEETGMIIPIGDWVLKSACRQLAIIRQKYPQSTFLSMSVNLSAAQLTFDLVEKIYRLLDINKLSGSSLILEITESIVMSQSEMVSKLITDLRALKVRLHIDDFGTGYSSFKYLQDFPVDSIKIDRSFISQLENSHNNYEIVRTVVNLAHELGMTTIAEGVETQFQVKQLQKFGCESIQGYLISKPIPAIQLVDMLTYDNYASFALKETFV